MIEKTLAWVMGLEQPGGGIAAMGGMAAYPEVSGYLIPTFYDYGQAEIAVRLAEWLLTIQDEAGWFPDMKGKARTFDTAACMEGLGRAFVETQEARYQDAAVKAWEWLEEQVRPDGAMRVAPTSDKTHPYTMRASWLIADEKASRYWKNEAWGVMRTHYAAYALEGLWGMGDEGFVIANLLLARKAIRDDGLMPMTAGASWRDCSGSDTCATAQMAILYWKAGLDGDARRLEEGVRKMVRDNGSIDLGLEHAERNTWTAKWCLDMWRVIDG